MLGFRSKLSHGDVISSEFIFVPLHASVLLLSIRRLHQPSLLYLHPLAAHDACTQAQWSTNEEFGAPAYWVCISPTGQQCVLYSVKLPCFLTHCLPLDAQMLACWKGKVRPIGWSRLLL